MSRIEELIKEKCPDGVEYKKLGDIGRVAMCKRIMKNETADSGEVPFYKIGTFGGKPDAYISNKLFEEYVELYSYPKKGDILISASGTIGRTVVFNGERAYFQDSNIVWLEHDGTQVINAYLKYFYDTKPWKISSGGTISRLYNGDICKVEIPVPPIEVQQEIVRILDKFTELEAELQDELDTRKKQYEYYRDMLIENVVGRNGKLIEMLCQPVTDGPHTTPKLVSEGIPFISATAIHEGRIYFEDAQGFITKEFDIECAKKYKPKREDVFMVKSGSTTGKVGYVDTDADFNIWSPIAAMRVNSQNSAKYLFHLLQTRSVQFQVSTRMSQGSQPNLSMRVLEQFDVIIPTLQEQTRIVNILEKYNALCNDYEKGLPAEIATRHKQYEYYRDKLLTFKRKEV